MLLYKYRNWSCLNHQQTITKDTLYIPTVAEVNDPFDFQIPADYSLLDTEQKQNQYIEYLIETSKQQLASLGISIDQKTKELKAWFSDPNLKKILETQYIHHSNSAYRKHFGILSLSKRWDSILMWTHYSQNHSGFCIGIDDQILINLGIFGSWGKVHYEVDFPKIDPLSPDSPETIIRQSHSKAQEWQYEKEYRFVKLWELKEPELADRIIKLPVGSISEIIIGLYIHEQHEKEISEIAIQKGIPLYKIEKADKSFAFRRKRVH